MTAELFQITQAPHGAARYEPVQPIPARPVDAAICQQVAWKADAVMPYAVSFVRQAVVNLDAGMDYCGPDDLDVGAEVSQYAGTMIAMLREAHVIKDYWGHHPDLGIMHGRRKSKRESANGRKIQLYSLYSRSAAVEWLARHGVTAMSRQAEMAM